MFQSDFMWLPIDFFWVWPYQVTLARNFIHRLEMFWAEHVMKTKYVILTCIAKPLRHYSLKTWTHCAQKVSKNANMIFLKHGFPMASQIPWFPTCCKAVDRSMNFFCSSAVSEKRWAVHSINFRWLQGRHGESLQNPISVFPHVPFFSIYIVYASFPWFSMVFQQTPWLARSSPSLFGLISLGVGQFGPQLLHSLPGPKRPNRLSAGEILSCLGRV